MRPFPAALAVAAVALAACSPGPVRTDRVRIFDLPGKPQAQWGYDPPRIEVAASTTVTFMNGGTVLHTVTSEDPTRAFDVGANAGEQVTVRFDKAGTWRYHCGIHPDMKGVVQVCDGACR